MGRGDPAITAARARGGNGSGPVQAAERPLERRRTLPGGRAVAGGFLIALTAVGVFLAYSSATRRPRQSYVVAARAIPSGTRLTSQDLRVVALDLPDPGVRSQVFNLPQALIGASTLAPLGPGALIEASAVVGRGGETGTREVSLELDRARAVAGTLKSGEYVDVLGTFGTGADAYTTVMVGHLQVVSITNVSSSLGDSRGQLITFAALTETDAEAIADAAVAAQVTLVRSAETGPGNPAPTPASPSYRAPGPPARTGN